ncbi:RNA ligase [Methylobacterium sp. AMS5]|uniref:RNA ligase n=1 Tax=Methylobacterium sp. AMS5 TaxID=925818 RepID=UPI00074F913F|nr:RNA ligase [Methylobacterium sp. AMS5]AMB46160.1 hypothetical protein Y590_14645 [Methylobacterium sp. AMS5]
MKFPTIEHLANVTPYVSFDQGFVVSRRPDHTVIDYVYTVPETFSSAMALECRGLKFDRDGRIIGRPFHKFFNLGERQRTEDIDWSIPHHVLDKLDGSMVHPVLLDGATVFMTRMGASMQAAAAQRHAGTGVLELARHLLDGGITPIFEFTSPDNRIVIAYDQPALTLLAAREMISGAYLPLADLVGLGERFDVPVVRAKGAIADAKGFVAGARREAGIEGYVLAFEDGHRLKLKTDGYVLRHRALSDVRLEKNVLGWVAAGAVDDVVPILPETVAARLLAYQAVVEGRASAHAADILAFAAEHRGVPRKDFAVLAFRRFDKRLTHAAFAAFDGRDPRAVIGAMLVHASGSEGRVEAVRDLFGMTWIAEDLDLPAIEA